MTSLSGNPLPTTPKRTAKMAPSQSLNHLLNFSLPPRQVQSIPRRSRKYGNQQGFWNKERFVNAQYRFVMNPSGDYTVHFADPDIFFQWHDILQVIIPRTSAMASAGVGSEGARHDEGHTSCPICLSTPVAPRMTKCGHVFCFPCILHLINTSDNLKWVRCPICFDSVTEKQLKAVKWYDGTWPSEDDVDPAPAEASSSSSVTYNNPMEAPRPGSTIRLRLMQRPQITTLALPRSQTWPSEVIPPDQAPFHFLPDVYAFAKFMLATPTYLIDDLTRDLDQLAAERRLLAGDELGLVFVTAAEDKVRIQMAKAAALETPQLNNTVARTIRDIEELQTRLARQSNRAPPAPEPESAELPEAFLANRNSALGTTPTRQSPIPSSNRNPRQRRNLNPPPPSNSMYYYYQAISGMPIFLHPLDIRILVSHFSSYQSFPDVITVRVDALNEGTVNDDLRKRCKYLGHMPEGADVVFIEADLTSVVGLEGLKNFEGLLKARRMRRKDKGKKDEKARVKAEEREKEREQELRATLITGSTPWPRGYDVVVSPSERPDVVVDEFPAADAEPLTQETQPPLQSTGAWGNRSFASTLNGPAVPRSRPAPGSHPRDARQEEEEEWEAEVAWQELEQRVATGGGRKKRGNRMVVLGGAGGRRR